MIILYTLYPSYIVQICIHTFISVSLCNKAHLFKSFSLGVCMCAYLLIFSFRIEKYFSICQLCPTFQMHSPCTVTLFVLKCVNLYLISGGWPAVYKQLALKDSMLFIHSLHWRTVCLYTVCTEGRYVYTQSALKDGTLFIHSLHWSTASCLYTVCTEVQHVVYTQCALKYSTLFIHSLHWRMARCLYTVCTEVQHVVYTQCALKYSTLFIHRLHWRMARCLYTDCTEVQHVVYTQCALKYSTLFIHRLHWSTAHCLYTDCTEVQHVVYTQCALIKFQLVVSCCWCHKHFVHCACLVFLKNSVDNRQYFSPVDKIPPPPDRISGKCTNV